MGIPANIYALRIIAYTQLKVRNLTHFCEVRNSGQLVMKAGLAKPSAYVKNVLESEICLGKRKKNDKKDTPVPKFLRSLC